MCYGTLKVLIPESLQAHLLNELHDTHPGIVNMKLLGCNYMWWPKLNQDVEEIVKSCRNCAMQRSLPTVVPLHSWPWANQQIKRIHLDFMEIEGWQVLILIDVHSKWIEAVPLYVVTAATTLYTLQSFFPNFGLPEEIVRDSGPQFSASTFSDFCKSNGIKHLFIPPYHPASNRAAERAVQVIKQAIKKMGPTPMLRERISRFTEVPLIVNEHM